MSQGGREGRGRGRARGRARGQIPGDLGASAVPRAVPHAKPAIPATQDVAPGLAQAQPAAPGIGRARGRAKDQTAQVKPVVEPQRKPYPAQALTRGTYRGAEIGHVVAQQGLSQAMGGLTIQEQGDNGNGNGGGERSVGRGLMRGRRDISNIIWTRPQTLQDKKGTHGKAVKLLANYFLLNKKHDWKLCLYHVEFSPEEDRTFMKKRLMRQHKDVIGPEYIFDGMQLYLPFKLAKEVTELASKREDDDAIYQVKMKFIKELSPLDSQYLQIMGILLRRCMEILGLQLIGRNYFNPKAEVRDEKYGIVIWPGFSTSIRAHEQSLLLNADVSHKFLRSETAYQMFKKAGRMNLKEFAERNLLGNVVMTKYNERTYRIDDVSWQTNPESKFSYKGGEISYMEYYLKNYNIKIMDPKQPMLLSKPKKSDLRRGAGMIYLVPELCVMTGLTDEMRQDFHMMKDLSHYMRMTPDKRVSALLQFNQDLKTNKAIQSEMENWGLQLASNLVQVHGRVLPPETIRQGTKSISFNPRTADWSHETKSLKLHSTINVNNWAVVHLARNTEDARELISKLQRVGPPMGMTFASPNTICLRGDSTAEFVGVLNKLGGCQLVVIVLPNNRLDRYIAIKRHLTIKMGIASQCVLGKTLSKRQRLMSVATKIAIQINCKLGGEPWMVAVPVKDCMVVGYDTYHDKRIRGSSYGGIVSSINQCWTRYYSQVARHKNQEELTSNFAAGIKRALEKYMEFNGRTPSTILVYRDGVGEGQIEYVKNQEVDAIKRCFEACNVSPKLAFIIVSKRITTRLIYEEGSSNVNPPPGTLVDDVITLPERYDFYLVSQSVNQGTVSPTAFNVIEDKTGLLPDHMQRLAYKLTHLYYNWQGTVRVPAPCQFAHKLAFLTGQGIQDSAHPDLMDRLWYL